MSILLAGGIYGVRLCDGLRWHHIYSKYHDNPFSRSKVVLGGDTHEDTDTRTARWSHKPTIIFLIEESRLRIVFLSHRKHIETPF
jgi:hypothetical protein